MASPLPPPDPLPCSFIPPDLPHNVHRLKALPVIRQPPISGNREPPPSPRPPPLFSYSSGSALQRPSLKSASRQHRFCKKKSIEQLTTYDLLLTTYCLESPKTPPRPPQERPKRAQDRPKSGSKPIKKRYRKRNSQSTENAPKMHAHAHTHTPSKKNLSEQEREARNM